MLYNKAWERPKTVTPVHELLKIENLRSWLATKDGDYTFRSNHHCLLAQYLEDHGHTDIHVSMWHMQSKQIQGTATIPAAFNHVAHGGLFSMFQHGGLWTFKKAQRRAAPLNLFGWRAAHLFLV